MEKTNYFNMDNTQGFNEFDLEAMNAAMMTKVSDWEDDLDVKGAGDFISDHCCEIIAQYASENGIELLEDYFD